MILTGPEIEKQVADGHIHVEPYEPKNVGPNSMDLRLGSQLAVYEEGYNVHRHGPIVGGVLNWLQPRPLSMRADNTTIPLTIPSEGLVLRPGVLYLGRTVEQVGTDQFVPMVEGRSSVGRLGMQVHVTAGFCDTGFKGSITLEITVVHPLRVFPNERVCQVYFTPPKGEVRLYKGRYQGQVLPTASRMHLAAW